MTLSINSASSALVAAIMWASHSVTAQQLTVTPREKSGIYSMGQAVGWTVALAEGQTATAGKYTYVVRKNGADSIGGGSFDLANGPAKIVATVNEPAMVLVEIKAPTGATAFGDSSTGGAGRVRLAAAVAPTKLQPTAARPDDFDAFWNAKLKLLDKVPEGAVLTPGESGVPGVDYATIRMNNINGAHVYGQIAKPSAEGKYPAVVIFQWASPPYPLQKQWVTDRAKEGWLAINIEPHDVPGNMPQAYYDALPQLIKNYASIGDADRDRNYFLSMYLGDYRAIEYVSHRPDWDGRTIVVMGTSMGGQQSFAVAGLNAKVTHLIVHVPAGSDALGSLHGRTAGYPNWNVKDPRVVETARYFDVTNFAPRITATSLVAMGFIDDIAPPAGIWTTFNQLAGPKEVVPLIDAPHNNYATPAQQRPYYVRSADWLNALVHGEPVSVRRQ